MFYNNNLKGILKLARKIYKRSYIKNLMVILAITLTTILVTANIRNLMVIGEINKNYGGYNSESKGDKAQDLEWSDLRVNGIGSYYITNYVPDVKEELSSNVFLVPKTLEEMQEELKDKYVTGRFPKRDNEIMIPSWLLNSLDRNSSNYKVTLNISREESSAKGGELKNFSKFYTVVGIYTEEKPKDDSFSKIYYYPKVIESNISGILIVFLMVTLISGYLLLNNIFHISVVKDTKLFGLLKTIGLTSSGIEKVIYYGAFLNSAIGIPIGIYLGKVISDKLIPVIFKLSALPIKDYSINEWEVTLLSTAFVIVTVYICAKNPKEYATAVSPIEACKFAYCEKTNIDTVRKMREKNILKRIAIFNMFGNERKTFLTIFSICISGVTLILSICFYLSFKPAKFIEESYDYEYSITLREPFIMEENFKSYSKEFLEKINSFNEIENLNIVYEKNTEEEGRPSFLGKLSNNERFKKEYLNNRLTSFEKLYGAKEGEVINIPVIAIQNSEVEELLKGDKALKESFLNGTGIILDGFTTIDKGEILDLTFLNEKEKREKTLKVLEVVRNSSNNIIVNDRMVRRIILSEKLFKEIYGDLDKYAKTLTFDLKEGVNRALFESKIRELIVEEDNSLIRIDSKYRALESVLSIRSGIFTVGMVVSFLIGLIGFISSVNTMLTSIFTRNLEFALFESVGMTKRQQRRMLIEEGNYFTLYATLFIVPISFIVTLYSSTAFSDYQGYNFLIYLGALLLTILIIYLIMSIIPIICYRYLKNKTVVDRIRSAEY